MPQSSLAELLQSLSNVALDRQHDWRHGELPNAAGRQRNFVFRQNGASDGTIIFQLTR